MSDQLQQPEPGTGPTVEIYVVDDDALLRDVTATCLQKGGYSFREFPNGEHAWLAFQQANQPPRLIISDYFMGQMTGLELIAQCRARVPTLKTILVSGTIDKSLLDGHPVRPDLFLQKPYPPKILLGAVAQFIGKKSS